MKIVIKNQPRLYQSSPEEAFLSIPPYSENGKEQALNQIQNQTYPRVELSDVLAKYNKEIGNDEEALRNCERLKRDGSVCIVTGQQLGLLGGPGYTILKAISCLKMAREMDAIPVFWVASEDHDVDEIDHTYLLDQLGNLQKFHVSLPKDGRFVESLEITEQHLEEINRFQLALGQPLVSDEWIGKSYVRCMLSFLMKLFEGTGLVFLEPYLLRSMSREFFHNEIEQCDLIQRTLVETSAKLKNAPIAVGEGTNLFLKVDGKYRRKIERTSDGFRVGHQPYSVEELQKLIEEQPERLSTNVAARPILQSLIIPTLAYVAGPGEIAYYHQLKGYYALHGSTMPWIVPRISVTFIPPFVSSILEKCGIEPWDEIPAHWEEVIPGIEKGVKELGEDWRKSAVERFAKDISKKSIETFTQHAASRFERKVISARLKKMGIPSHGLHLLRNLIHPHEANQERFLNWFGFQSGAKENLLKELLENVDWRTEGHVYCYYE